MPTTVGVLAAAEPERRVALTPDGVTRLRALGVDVLVEAGAGAGAWMADKDYDDAGAAVRSRADVLAGSNVLVLIGRPDDAALSTIGPGCAIVGMLQPLVDTALVRRCRDGGITAISLDGIPRTLSRAQSMDVLSSQANVAGYKAVLLAANLYSRYLPMLITAAGTAAPARVLILGAGIAGLQAIGTARRLGANVVAYDVRPVARAEVESLGAVFLELRSAVAAEGEGGYARALTAAEQEAQRQELVEHISRQDILITTAAVPGRKPPMLVSATAVANMRAGSVIVDLASGPSGGNVEVSRAGRTIITENGVTVVGADELPSSVPAAASSAYSRNLVAFLQHAIKDGELVIDLADEIDAGVVVTHAGTIVQPAVAASIASENLEREK
ncbi:MAG TPA: NAD(P) transhydrogenase subunit alpha [Mycobacteriales bacterium]|nr:NAD(P) transhydrogenase subunit alpha [Mycobacteriales bacterium]